VASGSSLLHISVAEAIVADVACNKLQLCLCAAAATLAGWVVALSSWVVREIDQRRQPQRRR